MASVVTAGVLVAAALIASWYLLADTVSPWLVSLLGVAWCGLATLLRADPAQRMVQAAATAIAVLAWSEVVDCPIRCAAPGEDAWTTTAVAWTGIVVYAASALTGCIRPAWLPAITAALAGSSLWFVALSIALDRPCPACFAAHGAIVATRSGPVFGHAVGFAAAATASWVLWHLAPVPRPPASSPLFADPAIAIERHGEPQPGDDPPAEATTAPPPPVAPPDRAQDPRVADPPRVDPPLADEGPASDADGPQAGVPDPTDPPTTADAPAEEPPPRPPQATPPDDDRATDPPPAVAVADDPPEPGPPPDAAAPPPAEGRPPAAAEPAAPGPEAANDPPGPEAAPEPPPSLHLVLDPDCRHCARLVEVVRAGTAGLVRDGRLAVEPHFVYQSDLAQAKVTAVIAAGLARPGSELEAYAILADLPESRRSALGILQALAGLVPQDELLGTIRRRKAAIDRALVGAAQLSQDRGVDALPAWWVATAADPSPAIEDHVPDATALRDHLAPFVGN